MRGHPAFGAGRTANPPVWVDPVVTRRVVYEVERSVAVVSSMIHKSHDIEAVDDLRKAVEPLTNKGIQCTTGPGNEPRSAGRRDR